MGFGCVGDGSWEGALVRGPGSVAARETEEMKEAVAIWQPMAVSARVVCMDFGWCAGA